MCPSQTVVNLKQLRREMDEEERMGKVIAVFTNFKAFLLCLPYELLRWTLPPLVLPTIAVLIHSVDMMMLGFLMI
jgi:hypothetical protein